MKATVDLGEIHLAAITTSTGKALIITGRGIRSLKRQRSRQLGQTHQKAEPLQKVLTALEEIAAGEKQGVPQSRAARSRPAAQSDP